MDGMDMEETFVTTGGRPWGSKEWSVTWTASFFKSTTSPGLIDKTLWAHIYIYRWHIHQWVEELGLANSHWAPLGAMDVRILLAFFWWRRPSLKVRNSEFSENEGYEGSLQDQEWENNPCQCLATRKAGASYKWTRCWTPLALLFIFLWLGAVQLIFHFNVDA